MKTVWIVVEYGEFRLVTSNKNTAFFHWWNQRRQAHGGRPDIYEWQLGKWGAYRHLGDKEVQDYINAVLSKGVVNDYTSSDGN